MSVKKPNNAMLSQYIHNKSLLPGLAVRVRELFFLTQNLRMATRDSKANRRRSWT
jgi:hypothetical protein